MTNKIELSYFNYSKHIISSSVLLTPFIILYELISFLKFYEKDYIIRNSADAILRDIFIKLTNNFFDYYSFLLFIFITFIFIYYKKDLSDFTIRLGSFIFMFLESILYSLILIIVLNGLDVFFSNPHIKYSDIVLSFYLCIGAGIWEEILFRFILISIFMSIFNFLKIDKGYNILLSVIFSAFFFSLFHYIGYNPDTFILNSFIIRFFGGFILGYIYIFRGLGIVALTHFFYDFILVSLPLN